MRLPAVLLALATLSYPALVYFTLQHYGARALVLPLVALALARMLIKREWIWGAIALLLALAAMLTNASLPVKLYPAVVSLSFLAVFGYSLVKPPSFVERIARLREPDLPPQAVLYTRRVTLAWCVYFVLNAAVATWIALFGSDRAWALYSGGIAYMLAGLLFAGEFLLRQYLRRKWRHA
ncbi:MAG: hypothetical protein WDO12_01030 [Pseudomonadota bacterium]